MQAVTTATTGTATTTTITAVTTTTTITTISTATTTKAKSIKVKFSGNIEGVVDIKRNTLCAYRLSKGRISNILGTA